MTKFVQFLKDESGASAAEYALILAIVGVALGAAALYLSVQIQNSMYKCSRPKTLAKNFGHHLRAQLQAKRRQILLTERGRCFSFDPC